MDLVEAEDGREGAALGRRMSSKVGQGRCSVRSKRNLMAHKAMVSVLGETRFSVER
jgi:hypothetical protein